MINYGILCTASIVDRYCKGIRNSKNGYVYGIASRSIERAKQAAQSLGIEHYYGSYEDLCKDENIDVVYIPTMNLLHYENAKMALSYHKNVVLEKPFVLNSKEAIELFELAKKNNCFLMEAQKNVFLPTTIKAKELIESGVLGEVRYVETRQCSNNRFEPGHWMDFIEKGGGAFLGSCAYAIEMMQYVFNEPSFETNASFVQGDFSADAIVNFHLKFGHTLVSSTISMNVPASSEAIFYGTKGKVVIPSFWKADTLYYTDYESGKTETFEYKVPSEFVHQVNHINECLENHLLESPIMNKEKTIEMVKILESLIQLYTPKENI